MPISPGKLREVMGYFATGVTVVTTRDLEGNPQGMTANAVTSLSLEPPLVLICVDKSAGVHQHLEEGRYFALNILREEQKDISRRFALARIDRFEGINYRFGKTGVPILEDILAFLECRVTGAYPGGDHTIFLGEVEVAGILEGSPLIFYRGEYTKLKK